MGILPGTPGLESKDPKAPETVLRETRRDARPRYMLKANAGFGGVNGALVFEQRGLS